MGVKNYPGWTQNIPVGAGIFDLYPSLGDVNINSGNVYVPTLLDGPIQVVRYGALTVGNSMALTASNRCRGLIVLCDSLTMPLNATVHMVGKGAKGNSGWPLYDLSVPASLSLSGGKMPFRDVADYFRQTGHFIGDPVLWAAPPKALGDSAGIITPGTLLMSAAGCGGGDYNSYAFIANPGATPGLTGSAGSSGGTGGGGSGGGYGNNTWYGAKGRPWGGGPGGAGAYNTGNMGTEPDMWGGQGGISSGANASGGAGNPSGNNVPYASGTGGILIVICRGNVNIGSNCWIYADGLPGEGTSNGACGAGSGGGHVSIIHGGTLTNNGTIRAIGGAGGLPGNNNNYGGAGGAGSVVTKTFAQMGW